MVWRCWGLLGAGGGRRIHGRFTPTPGSGLNLVEVWFGIIERQAIPGEPSPEPVKSSAVVYERFFVSILQASHYRAGELYLFCRTERPYPSSGSLFGIFDKEASGVIYLESSSSDLCHFRLWHRLPRGYRCSRCATRSELRDYIFNLACYEYRHTGHRPELPYENLHPFMKIPL